MSATKYIKIDGKFPMHRGGYLESPSIAYETWGTDDNEWKYGADIVWLKSF